MSKAFYEEESYKPSGDYIVIGRMSPDPVWARMQAVAEACEKAGVSLPPEVREYFEENEEEPARDIDLGFASTERAFAYFDAPGVIIFKSMIPDDVEEIWVLDVKDVGYLFEG